MALFNRRPDRVNSAVGAEQRNRQQKTWRDARFFAACYFLVRFRSLQDGSGILIHDVVAIAVVWMRDMRYHW